MRIERLSLANFRGFEQIELSFEDDVTVIAGVNGVGKSAILDALATLFSRALPVFTPSASKPRAFTDEDIQIGKPYLQASANITVADQRCDMGIQRLSESGDEGDRCLLLRQTTTAQQLSFAEQLASRTLTGDLDAAQMETQRVLRDLRDAPNQPLAIYFSPRRQLPGRPRSLPEPKPFEVANAYGFALHDREVEVREFMHWFRVMEAGIGGSRRQRSRVLDELRHVVTAFVPEFTGLRIEERPVLRFVVDKNGVAMALNQLSDGERGLLAMIFDLTRRLSIANPARDDPIAEGRAIVLIDEIELHLHPQWQRQVLRRFTETFKGCQFIVTTHSPQVIGEVEPRCLRFLIPEDDRIIAWTPPRSLGLDASRVLEELMDVKARNAEIDTALHELFEFIEKEDFQTADQRIDGLAEKLGKDDVELTRARSLITFLTGPHASDPQE
ncbi:MAG: AAA family ATPase [Defluviicoccus sp.]|nr:AAA family ATPase [Defluviicoccus sp.]